MGKAEKIERFSAKGKVDKLFPFVHDAGWQCVLRHSGTGEIYRLDERDGRSVPNSGRWQHRTAPGGSYAESILMHRLEQEKDAGVQNAMRDALAWIKSRTK